MERRGGRGTPQFTPAAQDRPLGLISPSSDKRTNATFGGCGPSEGVEALEINPADAEARGLANGALARVWNGRGETTLRIQISTAVRPGVLYSPKGTWARNSPNGQTVNALIPADIRADIERGAVYNETFVDVAPAESGLSPC